MKTFTMILSTVLLMSFVVGCVQTVNVEQEKAKLLDTDREFAKTSLEKGAAEAFKAYLADNAIMFPEAEEPIVGLSNIYAQLKANQHQSALEWDPQDGGVAQSGEIGWTWGTYRVYLLGENEDLIVHHGKYLNVWIKQDDGDWKLLFDMGNSSPAPEES